MRDAVFCVDITNPEHLPLLRAVAARGYTLLMTETAVAHAAAAEGLPVRAVSVAPHGHAPAGAGARRILEGLQRVAADPVERRILDAPSGDFLAYTGNAFASEVASSCAAAIAGVDAFDSSLDAMRALREDVRLVVLSDDVSPSQWAIVAAARRAGVPSLQLGHGCQITKRPWKIAGEGQTVFADYAAAFGDQDRDIWIASGNEPERIFATGAPFLDYLYAPESRIDAADARRVLGLDPRIPTVLFLTSYADSFSAHFGALTREYQDAHEALLRGLADFGERVQLLVRPHPTEFARAGLTPERQAELVERYYQWVRSVSPACDVRLVTDHKIAVLRAADVVVLQAPSTSRLDAMILDRPVIVPMAFGELDRTWVDGEGSIVVDHGAEIAGHVTALLRDPALREQVVARQQAGRPSMNHGDDGLATSRVATLIDRLAAGQAATGSPYAAAAEPTVSIVIPVFDKIALTRRCLEAIEATVELPYEVLVVDNASTDGTTEFLRDAERNGRLRLIRNDENVGFARACNAAAASARGEFVLLLNNDTVPQPGWLDAMLAVFERDPSVGVVGSRLLYADDRIQHAGMAFLPDGRLEHVHRFAAKDAPEVLEEREVASVTGACLLMPRSLWEQLGGLDEAYPMYVEDVDLCMKAWDAGRRVVYAPESVVYHLENASVPNADWRDRLVVQGIKRLHERWGGRWPGAVRRLTWPHVLPGGPAHFSALALADELVEDPALLAGFRLHRDEGTLVIALPEGDAGAFERLAAVVAELGLDGPEGPDLFAQPVPAGELERLAASVDVVLTRRPRPELADRPAVTDVAELRPAA